MALGAPPVPAGAAAPSPEAAKGARSPLPSALRGPTGAPFGCSLPPDSSVYPPPMRFLARWRPTAPSPGQPPPLASPPPRESRSPLHQGNAEGLLQPTPSAPAQPHSPRGACAPLPPSALRLRRGVTPGSRDAGRRAERNSCGVPTPPTVWLWMRACAAGPGAQVARTGVDVRWEKPEGWPLCP